MSSILCEPAEALDTCYCACGTFGSLEEARAAVPEMLGRCEPTTQLMLALDAKKDRSGGYKVLSRTPSDSDAFRAVFMKILRSETGWCVESDIVPKDYPEKTLAVRRALNSAVGSGLLRREKTGARGYSYTIANWKRAKEGQKND